MNKYLTVATIVGVVFLGYLVLISGQRSENTQQTNTVQSSSEIVVLEQPYDFGDIDIFGGKVSTNYTLKNTGEEAVTITEAATSCMCTEGEITGLTFGLHGSNVSSVIIPAGGEEVVKATFDPLAHGPEGTGPITRELTLKTNSNETPVVQLRFSGNVIKN
tara:strand:- start:381643 stop:382125 length:483 start_codon:yes stop_codon:yes gene_type:complete